MCRGGVQPAGRHGGACPAAAATQDAGRTDAVVREAMAGYQDALKALDGGTEPQAQSPTGRPAPGGLRELTLEESVALALEQNLDIQVARLDPQSVDFQVAGFRNTFRPLLSTTFGQRDQVQLPTSQLNGGARRQQRHDDLQLRRGPGAADWRRPVPQRGLQQLAASTRRTCSPTSTRATTASFGRVRPADAARLQDRQHPPAARGLADQPRHLGRASGPPSRRPSPTSGTPIGISSSRAAPWTWPGARCRWPTRSSTTTRRGSKSARSRRSTSCRRRPKRPRAARRWRRPRRRPRPPTSRSSASW